MPIHMSSEDLLNYKWARGKSDCVCRKKGGILLEIHEV